MSINTANDRLFKFRIGRVWGATFLLVISFFIVWNVFWFTHYVVPLPQDDAKLWSYHRRRVEREGNNSIVLIGTSKMQRGFDQNKFAELTGRKSIQLAIVGQSPIPILQNLAEEEAFKGVVICDFSEFIVYQSEMFPNSFNIPNEWIKTYQESKTSDDFEFRLRTYSTYLIANPTLGANLPDALKNVITGKAFEKKTIDKMQGGVQPTYFDRSLIFNLDDYLTQEEKNEIIEKNRIVPIKAMEEMIEKYPPQPSKFLEIVHKIEGYVEKIQARGGKVIIVNFPLSGELEKLNDIAFPKKDFWDVFTKQSSARTIHYKDYPQLQFECSDGSHLDAKDTPQFTEALVEIIRKDLPK